MLLYLKIYWVLTMSQGLWCSIYVINANNIQKTYDVNTVFISILQKRNKENETQRSYKHSQGHMATVSSLPFFCLNLYLYTLQFTLFIWSFKFQCFVVLSSVNCRVIAQQLTNNSRIICEWSQGKVTQFWVSFTKI